MFVLNKMSLTGNQEPKVETHLSFADNLSFERGLGQMLNKLWEIKDRIYVKSLIFQKSQSGQEISVLLL